MFDSRRLGRANFSFSVLSIISFTAFLSVVLVANCFISSLSFPITRSKPQKSSSISTRVHEALLSVKEEVQEAYVEDYRQSGPPLDATNQGRIAWFKKHLPELEVFEPTPLAGRFDGRVREFLGSVHCSTQFFMTWISPARFFREREFLAVESLFKAHPHGCLVILSSSMDSARGYRILKPVLDRGFQVLAATPDLPFLFKDTPAESWFDEIKKGNKDPGEISLAQNLSNLIRLAALYKYGGVYLDTDFIVLRDFSGLRNSIGAQSVNLFGNWTRLNNAVLVFDRNHPLLYKFMEEFASTFDGNKWGHNGPYLVSRVVQRMAGKVDSNFTVLPPMAFYPVDWTRIAGLFERPASRVHAKWVEAKLVQLTGASYGLHLWNRRSGRLRIEEGSIIGRLASKNCVICNNIYSS
ncbi:LOW QUALITY PROTEIN: uncharacterized protein LOC127787858 [Diospyros lotus]|uniref:LOW QUALITY PROTEIN: uncharacterized protein LOC127787858 n=1 Tax=Diospyros lotus TaxID=55363 RepID=UPI002256B836|nr:LOW QUALITY PROTEIN: uncharacterized protein LOC127787858 [Diospyros lotus]